MSYTFSRWFLKSVQLYGSVTSRWVVPISPAIVGYILVPLSITIVSFSVLQWRSPPADTETSEGVPITANRSFYVLSRGIRSILTVSFFDLRYCLTICYEEIRRSGVKGICGGSSSIQGIHLPVLSHIGKMNNSSDTVWSHRLRHRNIQSWANRPTHWGMHIIAAAVVRLAIVTAVEWQRWKLPKGHAIQK